MSAPRDDKAGDDKNPLVERPPDDFAERIAAAEGDEKLHVRVAADLSPDLSFGQRWLIVTDKRIVILDAEEAPLEISLGEVTSAQMRSLVGGARLVIERKDKTPVSVYVSSTAAPTFADAADRIGELVKGGALKKVKRRERQRCPSCDRYLPERGMVCPFCLVKRVTLKRILSYLAPYKKAVAVLIPLMVGSIGIDMVPPLVIGKMIDEVLVPGAPHSRLYFYVGVLLGLKLVSMAVGTVKGWIAMWMSSKITIDVRTSLCRALLRHSIAFYDERQAGMLMSRFTNDAGRLQGLLANDVPAVVINAVMLTGVFGFLLYKDWFLTLIVVAPVPLVALATAKYWRPMNRAWERVGVRWTRLSIHLGETLAGIRVVKAFGRERHEVDKFKQNNDKVFERSLRADMRGFIFFSMIGFAMTCGTYFAWWIGGRQVLRNEISLGELTALIAYLWMLLGPLQWFVQTGNSVNNALVSAERIFEILDTPAEDMDAPDAVPMPRIEGRITFENVTFGYDKEHPVLKDVSLDVMPGETIGIVGRSGSGKTTAMNLLTRFYDVDSGRILVDGVDIKKMKLHDLRSQLGVVMQDTFLFNGTVGENIAYGKPDATLDDVMGAAKIANAHDFVLGKADGYDSEVGERGCRLSGGEKQRVGIARAVLRDPRILVLDEATSNLDTRTERSIQEAIYELAKSRTTFIIAHRLSTIRRASRVVVVDQGRFAEVGTHQELMEKKGIFYEMVQALEAQQEGWGWESDEIPIDYA
ncbi:MAG: ABC transporter ATP-binding protein [Myxococcales bacterium]|nr:ABC transporter ATP-binding protein [Myxococcales bacterium]